MIDLLLQYGLFLAKAATVVIAALIVIVAISNIGQRRRPSDEGDIDVSYLNDRLEEYGDVLREAVLDKHALKSYFKHEKLAGKKKDKEQKVKSEKHDQTRKARVYVINFHGDIRASAVESLRREITAILTLADAEHDEIVVNLESPGGMVHSYGLAASQLSRIRQHKLPLTICVDKVAASGGYMMACIGNRILAAPFAVVGSIGVVAQMPNIHRLLKKHDIDVELHTAGEYKRTLTVIGENTEAGRQKFREELEDTHALFKEFVHEQRPSLDMSRVATGEHWYGQRALALGLIDELKTSDEYLVERAQEADVYVVRYVQKHKLMSRLGLAAEGSVDRLALRWWDRLQQQRPWG